MPRASWLIIFVASFLRFWFLVIKHGTYCITPHRLRAKSQQWVWVRCMAVIESRAPAGRVRCSYRVLSREDLRKSKEAVIHRKTNSSKVKFSPGELHLFFINFCIFCQIARTLTLERYSHWGVTLRRTAICVFANKKRIDMECPVNRMFVENL